MRSGAGIMFWERLVLRNQLIYQTGPDQICYTIRRGSDAIMIYITGDIHGDPEGLFVKPFTKNLGAGDYVIICGGVRFIRQTGKSLSCSAVKNKRQLLNDRFIKAVRQRNKALYLVVRRL